MADCVAGLKKVHLAIKTSAGGNSITAGPYFFSFVFGAASEGLNPMEIQLVDKCVGDTVTLEIPQQKLHATCGHLLPQLQRELQLQILPQTLLLSLTIEKIEDCSQREIVKAIAASVGSGCGGGCDCGCS